MKRSGRFIFGLLWALSATFGTRFCVAQEPVNFVVLIASYNNAKWCKENLDSVFFQTYPHWRIYYIDDCSTDGTGEAVDAYIQERGFSDKCTVVHNPVNLKALANYYYATKTFDPHEVVVNLDGDDRLAHERVLEKLASVYADPKIWMTYGNYRPEPVLEHVCTGKFSRHVIRHRTFRKSKKWKLSHLRTYYAGLFQKIALKDLFYEGQFMSVAWDRAIMYPMIEMASKGHFKFIKEVLYIYNNVNPISDVRIARLRGQKVSRFVASRRPYKPLKKLFALSK